MDANPDKNIISPPRRRILRYALALSLAVHLAGLAASLLWPSAQAPVRAALPPIKVKAVIEEPRRTPPSEEKDHPAAASPPQAAAREPAAAQPTKLRETPPAAPRPPTARLPMPRPAPSPAQPADIASSRERDKAPLVEFAARAVAQSHAVARPAAALAPAAAPAAQARPQAVAARSPVRTSEPAAARAATVGAVKRVSLSSPRVPEPLLAPQEAPRYSSRPAAIASVEKFVRPASSPLKAIAVESQPSRTAAPGPRRPTVAIAARWERTSNSHVAPADPATVPANFSTVDLGALRDGYSSLVRGRIASARHYPPEGRSQGHEGRPVVSFLLGGGGELLELALLTSSGHTTLDRAALAAVERAAPFPGIPALLGERSMRFNLPVSFKLESP